MKKVQFTLLVDKTEIQVVAQDGGVAVIDLENPEEIRTTYYQNRVDRLAREIEITAVDWEELAEGKSYCKDWREASLLELIKDAVCWLMVGADKAFPKLERPPAPPSKLASCPAMQHVKQLMETDQDLQALAFTSNLFKVALSCDVPIERLILGYENTIRSLLAENARLHIKSPLASYTLTGVDPATLQQERDITQALCAQIVDYLKLPYLPPMDPQQLIAHLKRLREIRDNQD